MPFFTSPPERTAWSRLPTKQMGFPPPPISPARRSGLSLWEAIPPFPRPPIPRQAVDQGKIVVVTTQVQNEGSDLAVYNVGHRLKRDLGVLESYDMTIEAAVAKLMWALAQTRDSRAVAALFYTPVAQDILSRPE